MTAKDYLLAASEAKTVYAKKTDDFDTNIRWWMQPDELCFQSVFAVVNQIESELTTWRFQCKMYRFLYANPEAFFVPNTPLRGGSTGAQSISRRVCINVVQSCVDTAASMIAKNQPKPQFMTQGEDNY